MWADSAQDLGNQTIGHRHDIAPGISLSPSVPQLSQEALEETSRWKSSHPLVLHLVSQQKLCLKAAGSWVLIDAMVKPSCKSNPHMQTNDFAEIAFERDLLRGKGPQKLTYDAGLLADLVG